VGAVAGELAAGGSVEGEACHQSTWSRELKDIIGNLRDHGVGCRSYQALVFEWVLSNRCLSETTWFDGRFTRGRVSDRSKCESDGSLCL
jgi:hypothetical protein